MKKPKNQKKPVCISKTKTIGSRKTPRVTIVTISFFSIAILMTSSISPVVTYAQSISPKVHVLSKAQNQFSINLQSLMEKSSLSASRFLYLYIAFLHFIFLLSENTRPLLSLIESFFWPIIDIYVALALIILFIYLWNLPELPHQNIRTFLSQIHDT